MLINTWPASLRFMEDYYCTYIKQLKYYNCICLIACALHVLCCLSICIYYLMRKSSSSAGVGVW